MTLKQKEQYEIRYDLDNWLCQRCGERATQIAHRIAKTKTNYRIYGADIIDHNINLVASCQTCNDYFNIGYKPEICKRLFELIKTNGKYTSREVNEIIYK